MLSTHLTANARSRCRAPGMEVHERVREAPEGARTTMTTQQASDHSAGAAQPGRPLTKNQQLLQWVEEMARLTKPDHVVWCDGSEEEKHRLTEEAVAKGVLLPLSPAKLPGSYLHRSNPNDVARVEQLTF